MGLREHLKATAPVTRAELDALRAELAAFKRVAALAVACAEQAARFSNVHGGPASTQLRLQKIASGAAAETFDLSDAEAKELRDFLPMLEEARKAECERESEEERRRTAPDRPYWNPDGTCARRIT